MRRVGSHIAPKDVIEPMMEGISTPIIQRQLGHVSLATTDVYLSHIAPKQVIDTMKEREWSP